MKIDITDEDKTKEVAEKCAQTARIGDIYTLSGNLGAGKTTFAKFFIKSLLGQNIIVQSPTFTLLNLYEGKINIYHYDFYRVEDERELQELALELAFENGITLIEWPEIAKDFIPEGKTIPIKFSISDNKRYIEIKNITQS
jgi:tRNA threonylcarbamoyl adenosine modification protein YjeE